MVSVGGDRSTLIKAPDRLHIDTSCLGADKTCDAERNRTDHKERAENRLNDGCFLYADDVQPAEENQDAHGKNHLAHPHIESGDGVMEAEFQDIGRSVNAIND